MNKFVRPGKNTVQHFPSLHADFCIKRRISGVVDDDWLHLLSHDLLPEMYPEIWRGFGPSVSTEICSCPRDNQKSSRLFRSASTSARSESCRPASENMFLQLFCFIHIHFHQCMCVFTHVCRDVCSCFSQQMLSVQQFHSDRHRCRDWNKIN